MGDVVVIQNIANEDQLDAMHRVLLASPNYKLVNSTGDERFFRSIDEMVTVCFSDGNVTSVLVQPTNGTPRRYSLTGEEGYFNLITYLRLLDQMTTSSLEEGFYRGPSRALFHLLSAHKYERNLRETFRVCGGSSAAEFHKAFRQTDVLDNGNTEMAVWVLLGESPYALWLIEFLRNWERGREPIGSDAIIAYLNAVEDERAKGDKVENI